MNKNNQYNNGFKFKKIECDEKVFNLTPDEYFKINKSRGIFGELELGKYQYLFRVGMFLEKNINNEDYFFFVEKWHADEELAYNFGMLSWSKPLDIKVIQKKEDLINLLLAAEFDDNKIKVDRIMQTSYEDGTYWVEYTVDGKLGYEILEPGAILDLDKVEEKLNSKDMINKIRNKYKNI